MHKKYGLLGHPLGHSFSKKFHNERFERLGTDAEYVNFDLEDISKLPDVLLSEPQLCGLNVTIPYKQLVMQYLDELDPVAERIGAVNTVCVRHVAGGEKRFSSTEEDVHSSGKIPGLWLKGYNTDIIGFRDSIRPLLQQAGLIGQDGLAHPGTSALILGTGGASKAVRYALEEMHVTTTFVSRSGGSGKLTYEELTDAVIAAHRIVVNCTPMGMFPHVDECPDLPYESLTPQHVCYDLVYNPEVTLFLAKAKEKGAYTMSGGAMLEGQAIASYRYWTEG